MILTRWRTTADPRIRWRLEFKLEDLWIGAFWHVDAAGGELWICFVPCLPLHFDFTCAARDENS